MKTIKTILFTIAMATGLLSCSADDEGAVSVPQAVKVKLFEDTGVMENSAPVDLSIDLERAAFESGFIVLRVTSTKENDFQTTPDLTGDELEIPVTKGATSVKFKFSPVNNEILEENTVVTFELVESSEGLSIGPKHTTTVEILDDESAVEASFYVSNSAVTESNSQGVEVKIYLSGPAPGEGTITMEFEGEHTPDLFNSEPAMDSQGKIILQVSPGANHASFRLIPKDNSVLENHKPLKLRIIEASGSLVKGEGNEMNIILLDDEILGRIKSAETIKDGRITTKTWEYDLQGNISRITVVQNSSNESTRELYYNYDAEGRLMSVTDAIGNGDHYIWTNGKITRSENYLHPQMFSYSTYEYDAGNISVKTDYSLKSGGVYTADTRFVYEYFTDGNIKKRSSYSPGNASTWVLNSSVSFGEYMYRINPDPLEIIPGIGVQQNLPGFQQLTGDGTNFSHTYVYEFYDEGKVLNRKTSNEIVNYSYY